MGLTPWAHARTRFLEGFLEVAREELEPQRLGGVQVNSSFFKFQAAFLLEKKGNEGLNFGLLRSSKSI